jgi:hypothetical protein
MEKLVSENEKNLFVMDIEHYQTSRRQVLLNYFKMVETQNQNIVLNKIYHPIQKKYTSQNVKGRRAKQISVM